MLYYYDISSLYALKNNQDNQKMKIDMNKEKIEKNKFQINKNKN